MAHPLPPGLTPPESAFLCEMEQVTVVPRQRLEGLELLGRQRRANIIPPPWLSTASLDSILKFETSSPSFSPPPPLPLSSSTSPTVPISPPFLESATADALPDCLPYHWLEVGEMILDAASDDIAEPDTVRRLMRDLREVRMAKMRAGGAVLEGGGQVKMNGVGGMEVAEGRAFIVGVVDGLRKIGASKEQVRREKDAEEKENRMGDIDDDEDEMGL
ncbi:MAG: hypothetical protein LQ342_003043 [Letrouitia transgressa]|nr:MAG: hypothetical protein LQ342_003043 [Letrouitia transgressa]